jgi:hypothetical protein
MIILVLSSMSGVLTVVNPYLRNQSSRYKVETDRRLAEYLLLDPGDPADWGSGTHTSLTRFGLAKSSFLTPFELDIDKVAKLNQENVYHVSLLDVFRALRVQDKPLKIRVKPLLDVTLDLASQSVEGDQTIYRFNVYVKKSNSPMAASLRCFTVLGDYVVNTTSSTSSLGMGSVETDLPNSLSGTALLIVLAKVEPRIVSYSVYPFKHNSLEDPHPLGTFVRLSPLNYRLRVEFLYPAEEVSSAKVFTYNYSFDLTKVADSPEVEDYSFPQLLDVSPMVLVVTGLNQSTSFAEWVSHPPLPLDFGSDFTEKRDAMNYISLHYLVSINSALYECEIILGEQGDDA